ncbi:DUF4013 domain-containing protein [uncultured Methanobrevibacter sp.]|uniref:DUF4013 domain-containing protein n=1 Tax=uncultured Methanobrevibacter sp. TaxID=253161 RepID=UPI0025E0B76F|nr:DUF4013 domain-containing protein [uncultured Methanobrevibacter sp.]
MILDIYKDALEYSAKDWKTLVLLGVFFLFSFLLLPIFLVAGYNYRVISNAVHGIINGRDPLPEINDIVDMFVSGVKVVIVMIAYMIVPVILFVIFAILASYLNGMAGIAIMIIGCLITLIVGVIAYVMAQMGLCHMVYNDGAFSKAFDLHEIRGVIEEVGWFECIITYLGLIIITVAIAFVVSALIGLVFTVLGFSGFLFSAEAAGGIFFLGMVINWLISMFFVGPYLGIFNSRSIGLLYTMQI